MIILVFYLVIPVLADEGAGEEYLEMTETRWDGKTPWFTGSSMASIH